jgi:succinate dehydrogenase / fumarate reductase cytochrome b subunit
VDTPQDQVPAKTFLARNDFLIRRLHSLSGLVPVGAYMVVHLLTNATVLDSPSAYQRSVYMIHSLGALLPLIEWTFIFIPLLFHAIIGVVIIQGGLPNSGAYRYGKNIRYTLQRATGMIAFLFIFVHVFHMHGWFHFGWWVSSIVEPLGGGQFRPYNATSSLGAAMNGFVLPLLYAIGVLSCVFHLANGLWTMGITWGVWVSPAAQRRADVVCATFGIALAAVSMGALFGAMRIDEPTAKSVEDRMYEARVASGDVDPNEHKRTSGSHSSGQQAALHK